MATKRSRAEMEDSTDSGDNGMVIVQDASGNYIQTEDSQFTIQEAPMNIEDMGEGAYTIATNEAGETYITSADGQFLVDDSNLVISTEDGQQVVYQGEEESLEGQVILQDESQEEGLIMAADQSETAAIEIAAAQSESENQYKNLIIQHMDISEPLTTLRKLLEQRLHCSLKDHEFYLQDQMLLDPKKNLTTQCVQGDGMVQINVEVKSSAGEGLRPRLNIIDILKPAEDIVEKIPQAIPSTSRQSKQKVVLPFPEENENVTRWIVDQNFRREQERLKIPLDPMMWNSAHVRHWIQWAIKEFSLRGVNINNFAAMTGRSLCDLKHADFIKYVPSDAGDVFWTHLELLRKCKFVAVIQQPTPHAITTITVSSSDPLARKTPRISKPSKPRSIFLGSERGSSGNRTGNNGQIQLWQFLLELLTDKDYKETIHWVGEEGEFKLANPEMVAQLWGARKNKSTMNYEKLSRALRYYYDGDMIAKVHGKRLVYKFICDLRALLGYNAAELSRLVDECSRKPQAYHH